LRRRPAVVVQSWSSASLDYELMRLEFFRREIVDSILRSLVSRVAVGHVDVSTMRDVD
jgi:hypothetical protein